MASDTSSTYTQNFLLVLQIYYSFICNIFQFLCSWLNRFVYYVIYYHKYNFYKNFKEIDPLNFPHTPSLCSGSLSSSQARGRFLCYDDICQTSSGPGTLGQRPLIWGVCKNFPSLPSVHSARHKVPSLVPMKTGRQGGSGGPWRPLYPT